MGNKLTERFGREMVINEVIIGKNLNVKVIRGFATLDQLAYISAPDVYNQITNPLGTQRDPDNNHARAVLDYAINSLSEEPDTAPRAFPEIILNVRDTSVISLHRGTNDEEIEFSSINGDEDIFFTGNLVIHAHLIDIDRENNPYISRVDGNHRLLMVAKRAEDDPEEVFPVVPFSMFVGLTADQERALFRDINGEQKSMDTAHLDTIRLRLQRPGQMLQTQNGEALWAAQQLSREGYPFENLVFFGGNKREFKKIGLSVPPVKINALKGAVLTTLKYSQQMSSLFTHDDQEEASEESRMQDSKHRLILLNRYWSAVKNNFPEAWQDRTKFILLQAIGLHAFSRLGAVVIDDLVESRKVSQKDFDQVLKHVASKVNISRDNWVGYAGLAGGNAVYAKLSDARLEGFDKSLILDELKETLESPLDR